MKKYWMVVRLGVVAPAVLGIAQTASGQEPKPSAAPVASNALEEIVVTARKAKESLQEVPLAITALTADALTKANAREIRDIAIMTPGLNISGDGSERNQQPSIRGLSFTGGNTQEGNVAVMLDGIYISNPGAMSLGMMDFARVEVVKGPQSALYGHNAFAGAINYVPKIPQDVNEASVQFRGGTHGAGSARVTIGGPIVQDLIIARAAATYDRAGGTYTDPVNDKQLGGYRKRDADLVVRVTPTDWTTYDIGFYYGKDIFGRQMQASFPNNCARNATTGLFTQYCGELPSTESLLPLVAPTKEPNDATGNDREVKHARAKATFDLGEAKVEVSGGYFGVKTRNYGELFGVRDGLPYPLVGTPAGTVNLATFSGGRFNIKDYSGEIRISSNENQRLRWALGAYYYKADQEILTDIGVDSDPIPAGRSIVCPSNFACIWLSPGAARLPNPSFAAANNRQASAFASLAYDLTNELTASAEARVTREDKKSNVASVVTAPGTDPDGPNGQRATFKFWNPRFTANYKLTQDNLLYASAAKGTKSGGFNQSAIDPSELSFNPENNWTYEIGSKNTLFDRKLRLNVAAFYVDWTDLQILVPSANVATIGAVTKNYGSVKAMGGEIELAAQLYKGVTFNTGVAYTNPKFGSDTFDYSNVATCRLLPECAGRIVENAPSPRGPVPAVSLNGLLRVQVSQWQYTAGLDVVQPLTVMPWAGKWSWFAAGTFKYESKQYTQIDDIRWIAPRKTLGLQLGLQGEKVRLALWVQNALNDLTPFAAAGGQGITRYNNLQQVPKESLPDQRRIGVTLDYSF